jgi:hypothetical protein
VTVADLVLLAHAGATVGLAGLIWTVQLVVYPGFRETGPTAAWPAVHAAHSRRIAGLVAVPWAVQGLTLGVLLLWRPAEASTPLLLAAAGLAVVTVAVTAGVSVPLHRRLARAYDPSASERLVRTNWLRTTAWTAGAVCALALLA